MRQLTQAVRRDLPTVTGARRLLATGQLGTELVRLSHAAATLDRQDAARLSAAQPQERPMPTPEWVLLSGDRR